MVEEKKFIVMWRLGSANFAAMRGIEIKWLGSVLHASKRSSESGFMMQRLESNEISLSRCIDKSHMDAV